jgi:hypothetical protein
MTNAGLERLRTIVDEFHSTLQQAAAPAEFAHIVGVMNGMLRIYDRTAETDIDPMASDSPLVALPTQVKFLEDKLNAMLSRIADVSVKLKP